MKIKIKLKYQNLRYYFPITNLVYNSLKGKIKLY